MNFPKLTSIADLIEQPPEATSALVERAMQLSTLYEEWKGQEKGGYSYTVDIVGERERAPGIHASELNCARRVTYSLMGTQRQPQSGDDTDVNMKKRFSIGHAVHALLQKEFEMMCDWVNQRAGGRTLTYHPEVKIYKDLNPLTQHYQMSSSCDGVFVFWHGDMMYLRVGTEIKTKSGPEFEKLIRPDEDHLEQTCFYMAALDLPLMWIPYYNKSNSNMTPSRPPYLFKFDSNLWSNKLEPTFNDVMARAQTGNLPDRKEGMHCSWCPFTYTCQPKIKVQRGPTTQAHRPGAFRR